MRSRRLVAAAGIAGAFILSASCSQEPADAPPAAESGAAEGEAPRQIERYPLRRALFGDMHVHTAISTDAWAGGNRLGLRDAYRFARGEEVELPSGADARLARPLDFVALTDHAEGFDAVGACVFEGDAAYGSEFCERFREAEPDTSGENLRIAFERGVARPAQRGREICPDDEAHCLALAGSTWRRVQEAANEFNDPGAFTTLIAYEFSALLPSFGMLHRNVFFRGSDVIPHAISAMDVRNQADFFERLDAACQPPCAVITIPHNTNYSWGTMFSREDEDGTPYTAADLERRKRIDRLVEVTQIKGSSECQVGVGTTDEECDFGNLFPPCGPGESGRCAEPGSFLRNALLDGIQLASEGRPNPFRYGMIGSTDTHNSDPGNTRADSATRFGMLSGFGLVARRILQTEHVVVGPFRRTDLGGLAGVWAEANTREAIFDALERREAFGTSGSRMRIRFFAGDLPAEMGTGEEQLAAAYAGGVPMGGELRGELVAAAAPSFWAWAVHDPEGPALDRIQVIKGWVEDPAAGEPMHRVWDVACSDGREAGADGRCPPTDATVDIETCEAAGDFGAAELSARFTDPDYRPDVHAFYYVRVLENPTCRWTTRLANGGGVDLPEDIPVTQQERGWSSPVWVRPQ